MTKYFFGLVLAAASIAPLPCQAQTPPAVQPPIPAMPARVRRPNINIQGQVSAVDAAKKTITLSGRRGGAPTTLPLAPNGKVYMTQPAALTDIKTGETIDAYAANLAAGATTVMPDRLFITLPPPATAAKAGKNAGFHRAYVQGVVASISPMLTMTTAGGVTVTVTATSVTPVTRLTAVTLASVAVGANVQGRTNGDATNPAVVELRVMPARQARRAGPQAPGAGPAAPVAPAQK